MKHWKTWQICLFTALCIALNIGGLYLGRAFELPIWLDSFGTVLCAYIMGPVCGAIVGVTSNLLHTSIESFAWVYGLTSIALAMLVGHGIKSKTLENLLGAMTISVMATIISVAVSVPLNLLLNGGMTSNKFGDAVIEYLSEHNFPHVLCAIAGQFYVDFLDKLVTIFMLYLVLMLFNSRGLNLRLHWHENAHKAGKGMLLLAVTAGLLANLSGGISAGAEVSSEGIDYSDYVQTIYNSNNGLPCGEANDIAQTTDGILWIGTYAGLYRYNGREFRWMDSMENVRNANCLYVDEEGRLWCGTNDKGLAIIIDEKIVNVIDQSSGLTSNSVRSIVQSSDGYYYVGTTASLHILTLNSGLRDVNELREMYYTDCLTADKNGNVAAVTADGRLFLLNGGEILSSLRLTEAGEDFKCCGFDEEGQLIAGTSMNRLLFYNVAEEHFDLLREMECEGLSSINDLYFPGNGGIFISADNGASFLDRNGGYHRINTNDFNNSIDNALMDYQGNLWFTSSRLGLLRLAASSFRDVFSTVGMENRVVNAVAEWQGKLYFGTDNGLEAVDLNCREQLTDDLTKRLDGVRIRCLMTDQRNHLWICTYGKGLWEAYEDETVRIYSSDNGSFGNRARVTVELKDGTVLAGGDTGISFIRDSEIIRTIGHTDGLINSMILTATELPDGRILAGTDGDGIAIIEDGAVTKMLVQSDGLSSEVILRTVADPEGKGVFIVTSNGLCYLNEDMTVRQLDKFPYFNNYNIHLDGNMMFVMSSAGLYVADRRDLLSDSEDMPYELLDSRRGLNSALTANSWTYCDKANNLYLPCDTGVFVINLNSYATTLPSFRMAIPYVRMDGKTFRTERNMPIEAGNGVSRIELTPEIINYSVQIPNVGYYLEGFDNEWTILPQNSLNSIVYTNLPAGEYILHLGVFDNEKKNVVTERLFELDKSEEFYETTGFRLYFFGVITLFAVFLTALLGYRGYNSMKRQAEMGNQAIIAIAKTVDAKDIRTSQHSERVSRYSELIAREAGMTEKECENIRRAALMHDIGKIAIPDSILNKPSRLTDEEYAKMKTHTTYGSEILKDMTLIKHVGEGALYHHERPDGKGYPFGLKREEIPKYARIIGVADAFDAMTANRVYRNQMDFGYVINELRKGRGTQFDPEYDDILLKLLENGTIDLNAIYGKKNEPAAAAGEG